MVSRARQIGRGVKSNYSTRHQKKYKVTFCNSTTQDATEITVDAFNEFAAVALAYNNDDQLSLLELLSVDVISRNKSD